MLSRRDVAAMRLAIDCLRRRRDRRFTFAATCDAATALMLGDSVATAARRALWPLVEAHRSGADFRLTYARLALLLRTLLRADAGDYGRVGFRPLWESAPPHSPDITPRDRRERKAAMSPDELRALLAEGRECRRDIEQRIRKMRDVEGGR